MSVSIVSSSSRAGCAGFESGNSLASQPGAVGVQVVSGDGGKGDIPGFKYRKQLCQIAGISAAGAGGELPGDKGISEGIGTEGRGKRLTEAMTSTGADATVIDAIADAVAATCFVSRAEVFA